MQPIIFVSHIREEQDLAVALKQSLRTALGDGVDVFVSSDRPNRDVAGVWLDDLTAALETCAALVILASPRSVARSWITFEAGCGFVRGIPVFTLCHGGLTPDSLPEPLSLFPSALLDDADKLRLVLRELAATCGCEIVGELNPPATDGADFPRLRRAS